MRVQEAPVLDTAPREKPHGRGGILLGFGIGILASVLLGIFVVGPFVLSKRNDLPLERIYGDFAVSAASRLLAGNQQNPLGNDRRALAAGREAYTGSCGVCHGANGDGKGVFGPSSYPNATDLRTHDAAEKSDAQLFWIIKNGLSFTGMPAFEQQYSDQDIWSLVSYIRALQDPNRANAPQQQQQPPQGGPPRGQNPFAFQIAAIDVPTPTPEQLQRADPTSGDAAARGAAVYFAQGCQTCHGAVGEAPGDLGLRGGGPEAVRAVREGRPGMPKYDEQQLTDGELQDMQAYLATFSGNRRPGGEGGERGPGGGEGGGGGGNRGPGGGRPPAGP